jgi:Ser/Thr protein kinase RdoA (MazF antagonist)
VRRLSGGASGAGVFAHRLDGEPVVLKVSAHPAEPGVQGRELRFYRELADRVPVRTPRLLDGVTANGRDILLLTRSDPPAPARVWSQREWLAVARQLGALHCSIQPDELAATGWSTRAAVRPDLGGRAQLWNTTPAGSLTRALLAEFHRIQTACTTPAACLIHGDCHADNLLRDQDQLVWVDWQAVGLGHGPEDLALLWQRAEYNGAEVPREPTLAAYADARGITADAGFRRAVIAAELKLLLLGWPDFLLRRDDAGRDLLIRRLQDLAAAWRHAPGSSGRG